MSSQLFCCGFFGAIYQDSYSTGCICTAASGGYAPLRSFFRGISDDLFFQARLGCAGGESRCVGGVPVRSFLWSVFSCIRSGCGGLLRGSPCPVRVLDGGRGGAGGGACVWAFFAVSLGRYFRSEQLFLHNFVYSARSGFNPTRSLSIFSENIKILSENIKKLVVI